MRRLHLSTLLLFGSGCGSSGQPGEILVTDGDTIVTVDDGCCCDDPCGDSDGGSSGSGGGSGSDPDPDPDPVSTCDCPDGFEATPDDDACVMQTEYEATFTGVEYTVCDGDKKYVYGMYGAQLPGGTQIQNDFWGQDNGANDGRLNEVGVWACGAGTSTAGTNPTNEWIGFSTCITLLEAGSYLVGIAGDNRVRFFVDGELFFEKDSSDQNNFKRWYLEPIELTSGTHIVELFGRNDGLYAAFGAELYGPFPADALTTDAQIEALDIGASHVVWSTGAQLGETFDLGEESGWVCPDGTAFDTCAASPICVEQVEEECLVDE